MRTLIHVSDLHFGAINAAILEPLLECIELQNPDLVAVSGDLTQRARVAEFKAARTFLDRIRFAKIVVPGNHDVPLYNLWARFFEKLGRYRKYIEEDLAPFFSDAEMAVAGINTARALTWKEGRLNKVEVAAVSARFKALGAGVRKIVVTHHPFDLPAGVRGGRVVGRARSTMEVLSECGVDVFLAGHFHLAHTGHTARRYKIQGYSALVISAGTTTSTRGRGEANSFNAIRIESERVEVRRWAWNGRRFEVVSGEEFERRERGWERLGE